MRRLGSSLYDGFRNYIGGRHQFMLPEEALVDRAQLLRLTAPEMTALVGGLRVLDANAGQSVPLRAHVEKVEEEVIRQRSGLLCDVLRSRPSYMPSEPAASGTRVDLIFGSHSQLRALAEVYGCSDSKDKFVKDFVAAWSKVMNLDRFDLA
jgi:catalase-peroxidase